MRDIFLSYRRGDSAGFAGRIAEHLVRHFGRDAVFRDVETIEAGSDFVAAIDEAVRNCRAFVLLVGPRWLGMVDRNGRRRLDDPKDFVRLEIEIALASQRRIVPVLLEGARMPGPDDLPADIAAIATRHAIDLTDSHFAEDMGHLIRAIDVAPAPPRPEDDGLRGPAAPRAPAAVIPIQLGWSYVSFLLCPPIGALAIRWSNRCAAALATGDIQAARAASSAARQWHWRALAACVPFWFVTFVAVGMYACSQALK